MRWGVEQSRNLMTVRMKRIQHPRAWSQVAEWATNHVVSNVEIEKVDANGDIHVLSRFHMMELRRDDLRHFGRKGGEPIVSKTEGKSRLANLSAMLGSKVQKTDDKGG